MTGMGDGHKLIGKTEVEMARVEAVVLGVVVVVPRAIHLAPLAVELHGVPGVAVVGVARLVIGDASGVQQCNVGIRISLAGTRVASKGRLGARPLEGIVVFKLVKQPVVKPEGHLILGAIGFCPGLRHGIAHDGGDAWIVGVRDRDVGPGIERRVGLLAHVHDVELVEVGARGCHGKAEVLGFTDVRVLGVLAATGVGHAVKGPFVRIRVGGCCHVVLVAAAAARRAHVEGGLLPHDRVIPLNGKDKRAAGSRVFVRISVLRRGGGGREGHRLIGGGQSGSPLLRDGDGGGGGKGQRKGGG